MNTPIFNFVNNYAESGFSRLHMPGHKGKSLLGCERLDITEIGGADVLYSANGIINESEENASRIFGTLHSFYSTEGSTLCIKAMLTLICKHSAEKPLILAARNVHKAFVYAAALLDFDTEWMYAKNSSHLCSCVLTKKEVEAYILSAKRKPAAVYLTSPDYLGAVSDIKGIAEVCDKHGVPLVVDNAHGAYLKFLSRDSHPITLGATMCCDSAHKTLPVLTGGAYLHLSQKAERYLPDARDSLALHASTSPSYLILQSLDLCNSLLDGDFRDRLNGRADRLSALCDSLNEKGIAAVQAEPLKLTVHPLSFGYTGSELSELMKKSSIICEFCDRDSLVLMFSAESTDTDFARLDVFFKKLERKEAKNPSPVFNLKAAETAFSLRKAMLLPSEHVSITQAVGRICAEPTVNCPPAVPLCISGEVITPEIAEAFIYYGFEKIKVVI